MLRFGSVSVHGWLATPVGWNTVQLLILSVACFVAYWFCLVFYRLFLHPLRNVPGPMVAAATGWFEFYQDVILDGHYLKEYPRLHAQYGKALFFVSRMRNSSSIDRTSRPHCTHEPEQSPHQRLNILPQVSTLKPPRFWRCSTLIQLDQGIFYKNQVSQGACHV